VAINVIGKTVMRSLFGKPATAMYPIIKNDFYPKTRGSIELNVADCIFCGMCDKRCPSDAISVSRPDRKWEIDRTRCIVCNFCVEVCPKKCLSTNRQYTAPMTDYAQRMVTIIGEAVPENA
jgi:formate hydrogenlyase subunit 6/NADH:ubiquinone oxidoreductase subunit I